MKDRIKRTILGLFLVALIAIPPCISAYEIDDPKREEKVRQTREDIYSLYELYNDIVGAEMEESEYGVVGYNGVCSTVTVGGKSMPLDDYIAGVIKQEMGGDNLQALKAQAIAARSFLLGSHKNASSCSVVNGQSYQAFTDPGSGQSVYKQAAQETSGMVVTRNGEVATTQYQSHPAGRWCTEDSSGWHIKFQRFNDDPSTEWTWNGPAKDTVRRTAGGGYLYGTEMNYNNGHHFGMSQTVAMYLAKGENYTYEKIIDLFYKEPIATISDGNYDNNLTFTDSEFGKIYYYNQGDFGNYYYSEDPEHTNPYGGTIASHGCGPTSAAIVAASMKNQDVSPVTMTKQVCQAGGCTSSGSYNDTLGQVLREQYNLNVKMTSNGQEVLNALGSKKSLVIVLMGPGTFTTGGHYIVLTGTNSNRQVSVADPASRARTQQKWFPFNTILEQRKTYANFTIVTKA